jgi:peptidoglycan/LPS O-acetylase OafA/YrhL
MSWQHQTGIGRNNLDFVRFVLAVAVILAHSYALLQGSDAGEPLMRATHGQITFGGLAVDWFFVISGFLIVHSWLRNPSIVEFLKKRVLRIYPGFIGALFFCTFIAAPLASPSVRRDFVNAVRLPQLIPNAAILRYVDPNGVFLSNPMHAVNGSLWSIPYEFWCYIGVVLLGLSGMIRKPTLIGGWFIFTILGSLYFVIRHYTPGWGRIFPVVFGDPSQWARLLPFYMAGVTFYLFRNRIGFSRLVALGCALLLIAGAAIPVWGVTLLLPTAGTYFLFWFAFEPRIRMENWARFGDFSYGIYVFAFPIQQLLIMKLGTHISPWYLFALATPLCILAGIISWHLIERRFLKLKKKPLLDSTRIVASTVPAVP